MERRTVLKTVGTATVPLTVALAGCGEAGPEAEDSPTEEEDGDDTPTEEEETPTETEEEETPTETEEDVVGTETETEDDIGGTETETEDGAAGPGTETAAGTDTAGGASHEIRMVTDGSTYYFDPIGLYVEPGDEITWINESGGHSSTAYAESAQSAETTRIPDDAEPWNSGVLGEEGAEFSHTIEVQGTYDYFCLPHKTLGMVGRVVVGESGGPATEGEIPNGSVPSSEEIVDQGSISWEEFNG